jgi:putative tnpX site-specific recombinase
MARVSKKVSAAQREAENAPHRIWKTAIYDFDDVLRDTESLEVQISYIKEYINHRDDLMLLDVFADKRCTGMNFDRPEFERLLKALQERKVNCIVVKDFSRLGRNFVETGQYGMR